MNRSLPCLLLIVACEVNVVELAPGPANSSNVILLEPIDELIVARFQGTQDAPLEPALSLLYPDDGAVIPANLAPLSFVFGPDKKPAPKEPARTFQAFELRVLGPGSDLRLYTTQLTAALPSARWHELLAATTSANLTLQLRALTNDNRVIAAQPSQLSVWHALPAGSIDYWSDTRQLALRARIDETSSRELQASYPQLEPSWQSVAIDDQQASCTAGELTLSMAGAARVVAWPGQPRVEQVELSPQADRLVVALTIMPMPTPMPGMMGASSIASALLDGDGVSAPSVLATANKADETLRFPSFSWDGQLVAFERAKGQAKDGSLWIVPVLGGEALQLTAPQPMPMKGEQLTGTLPTWLPGGTDDERWLVFSAARAPDAGKLAPEQLQLWALALATTPDGGFAAAGAAFWLPFQALSDSYRRALFVAD